jgi:hypothetical protein
MTTKSKPEAPRSRLISGKFSVPEIFDSAPEAWTLPITERGERPLSQWQQHEYVTCMNCGFSFAAHGERGSIAILWHYKLPTPSGWVYPTIRLMGGAIESREESHPTNPFRRGAA